MWYANCISLGIMMTHFACMVHKFVSSNMSTRLASDASCNAKKSAVLWNCRSFLCSSATLQTKCWKGALRMRKSVDFWYHQISWSYVVGNVRYTVTIDNGYMLGISHIEVMTWSPTYSNCSWMISMQLFDYPANDAAILAAFVANCFTEALQPVHIFPVCFVLAIMKVLLF